MTSEAPVSPTSERAPTVFLALPKGHMQEGIFALLKDCGYSVSNANARGYKPSVAALPKWDIKLLKVWGESDVQ